SRRRHTRWPRDWSSDVCSSDLIVAPPYIARHWFVTNALRTIERTARDQNEMVRRNAELVQYMAWKTAERTLRAYEHVVRDSDFKIGRASCREREWMSVGAGSG